MKKLIAILGAIVATSTLTAFGQDWVTFQTSGTTIWDNYVGHVAIDPAGAGTIDAILLWTTTGAADDLPSYGTEFGLRGTGAALDQVATNCLLVGSPTSAVNAMLSSGWNIAVDAATGTNAVANSGPGTLKGQVSYDAGATFQVQGVSGASGSSIEEIVLGYNSSASSWLTASGIGWSNPFDTIVGTSSGDPNAAGSGQSSANQFAVVTNPEPTTLALFGVGGLSILFLRRRKPNSPVT